MITYSPTLNLYPLFPCLYLTLFLNIVTKLLKMAILLKIFYETTVTTIKIITFLSSVIHSCTNIPDYRFLLPYFQRISLVFVKRCHGQEIYNILLTVWKCCFSVLFNLILYKVCSPSKCSSIRGHVTNMIWSSESAMIFACAVQTIHRWIDRARPS